MAASATVFWLASSAVIRAASRSSGRVAVGGGTAPPSRGRGEPGATRSAIGCGLGEAEIALSPALGRGENNDGPNQATPAPKATQTRQRKSQAQTPGPITRRRA